MEKTHHAIDDFALEKNTIKLLELQCEAHLKYRSVYFHQKQTIKYFLNFLKMLQQKKQKEWLHLFHCSLPLFEQHFDFEKQLKNRAHLALLQHVSNGKTKKEQFQYFQQQIELLSPLYYYQNHLEKIDNIKWGVCKFQKKRKEKAKMVYKGLSIFSFLI